MKIHAAIRRAVLAAIFGLAPVGVQADITISLINQVYTGFNFIPINQTVGQVTGTLTGASVNVTLNASTNFTYGDDLAIYVDILPLGTGGLLQIGGFSNLSATQRYTWPNGGSSAPGTTTIATVNLTTPLVFTGNEAVDGTIHVGNGYGAAGTSGTWSGTITLHGVDAAATPGTPVPEAGTAGALGMAALGALWAFKRRARRSGLE
jgi:hypothetical protein